MRNGEPSYFDEEFDTIKGFEDLTEPEKEEGESIAKRLAQKASSTIGDDKLDIVRGKLVDVRYKMGHYKAELVRILSKGKE